MVQTIDTVMVTLKNGHIRMEYSISETTPVEVLKNCLRGEQRLSGVCNRHRHSRPKREKQKFRIYSLLFMYTCGMYTRWRPPQ